MKNNASQSVKSKALVFLNYSPLPLMVAVCLAIALVLTSKGGPVFPAILVGAAVSAFIAFFVGRVTYLIWIHRTRGGPFSKGDRVEIIEGPHIGRTGEIRHNDSECNRCWIALDGDDADAKNQHFPWGELRKEGWQPVK